MPVTSLPCSWNKPGKGPVIVCNSNIRTITSKVYFRYQVPIGKVADLEVHSHRKKEVNLADISVVSDEEHKRTNELLVRVKHQLPIVLSVVPQYASLTLMMLEWPLIHANSMWLPLPFTSFHMLWRHLAVMDVWLTVIDEIFP